MRPVCFVDMDGVLCSFFDGAVRAHNKTLPMKDARWDFLTQIGFNGPDDPLFWVKLSNADFWANLAWTAEGFDLLGQVEIIFGPSRIALLSSPAPYPGCDDGKRAWIKMNTPAYVRQAFLGSAKHLMASPGHILLDDHAPNVLAFRAAGGHAIMIPRPWNDRRDECDDDGCFDVAGVVRELEILYDSIQVE